MTTRRPVGRGVRARRYGTAALAGALTVALALALGACQVPAWPQDEPASLAELGLDRVLVVGAVEIVPPLRETERVLDIPNDLFNLEDSVANRAWIRAAADPKVRPGDSRYVINPRLGETFFFAVPRAMPYLVGGDITVQYQIVNGAVRQRKIHIPGPLRLELEHGDGAVYIGTIRLFRDEFNEVVDVQVLDDFARALEDYRRRYGAQIQMRRALLQVGPGPAQERRAGATWPSST